MTSFSGAVSCAQKGNVDNENIGNYIFFQKKDWIEFWLEVRMCLV